MAGGTWTIQNKLRPGAYINFEAIPSWDGALSGRGVATMPLTMDWGVEQTVFAVTGSELLNGKATAKLGHGMADSESLIFRQCLQNCPKLLVYRLNSGGEAATATLGNLTATAACSGTRGNDLSVCVAADGDAFTVYTYLDGEEQDAQTVSTIAGLTANDWLTFSGSGALTAVAATALSGGSNGTVAADAYSDYFEAVKTESWQVMGIPADNATLAPLVLAYIRQLREQMGKKVQAVVYNYAAGYEGVISCKQGYSTATEIISATDFVAWVTGVTAGAAIDHSNTYKPVEGATAIVSPLDDEELEEALADGFFLLSRRTDGKIIVEQDINTLTDGSVNAALKKNRVVRTLDEIANTIAALFESNYIGRVDNNDVGRALFKEDILKYCENLTALGAITAFEGSADVSVSQGEDSDSVVIELAIRPVDAMEKLYMTVEVDV